MTQPSSGPFICSGDGNWDDPNDDCEKYYYCIGGVAYPSVKLNNNVNLN
jgi:hypothetical protein